MTHHPALKTVLALKRTGLALAALLALVPAAAQTPATQKVTGPQARYWVSAETGSGLNASAMQGGAGGLGSMMGALMGRGGPTKTLRLELGGLRDGQPSEAVHAVPASLGVGPSLVLLGPERAQAQPDRPERDVPEMPPDKPRGRMLFFWGCGESAGAGQPVVLDFARMADGVLPANLRSVTLPTGRSGPGFGRDRGYADWPNRRHSASVPAQGSLLGEHQVQGNFIPEIRFAVGAAHDYMDALTLSRQPLPSGAQLLKWNRPGTALGFFASGMGFKEGSDGAADMVMWNSSGWRAAERIPRAGGYRTPDQEQRGDECVDHRVCGAQGGACRRRGRPDDGQPECVRSRAECGASAATARSPADLGSAISGQAASAFFHWLICRHGSGHGGWR
jgi:hypothetical protein